MNVLVTGGAGYIGSIVSAELIRLGHQVTVMDDLSTGHIDSIPIEASFVNGSVLDNESLEKALIDIEAVIHFAAKSLVGESVLKPDLYWHNNLDGTRNLLDNMNAAGVKRIVFSSTAAVYGDPQGNPITEDAPTIPKSPYGASKLAVDNLLSDYAKKYQFAAISLRYFNVAGAAFGLGERHDPETHLIPKALKSILDSDSNFSIFGDDWPTPDGTCIRDYIHVLDLADAHIKALDKLQTGKHDIFNLGTKSGSSVFEVIEMIEMVTKTKIKRNISARRQGDPAILVASNEKAKEILNWEPSRNLEKIISDAFSFMKENS